MLIGNSDQIFLRRIASEGFAVVPCVFSGPEVFSLADKLARSELQRSRAGIRHAMRDAGIARLAHDPRLLEMARQALGQNAFPFRATIFDKSPTSNWLVVWHQDTALPLREKRETEGWGPWSVKEGVHYAHAPASALERVLALRVHLDDSFAENGPLRLLPGTQSLGVLSDEQLHKLSTKMNAVDGLVPRGGVLAMRPLIVHASSKSQSVMPRRVVHIEYASTASIAGDLQLAIA
jgi:ectoine hydroxylase-related dioxygenase (phytanoyl-CoA dioxygenase family)